MQLLGDWNLQYYGLRKSRSVHLSTGRSERLVLLYLQLKYVFRLEENASRVVGQTSLTLKGEQTH